MKMFWMICVTGIAIAIVAYFLWLLLRVVFAFLIVGMIGFLIGYLVGRYREEKTK